MKNIKKVKPLFNRIITTMNVYDEDQYIGGLIDKRRLKGTIKEYQTVVSVGNTVRDIKEGDEVCIDYTRYMVVKHNDKSLKSNIVGDEISLDYRLDIIKLDGKEHLMLFDQDVVYVVEESEDIEESGPTIIEVEKPKIIV